MASGQHEKFRRFLNFETPAKIWIFSGEKLFTVEHICVRLIHSQEENHEDINEGKYMPKALVTSLSVKKEGKTIEIKKEKVDQIYVPNNYRDIKSKRDLHKRFIPQERTIDLLPLGQTSYRSKFRNGATFRPRNLVFFTKQSYNDANYVLTPAKVASKKPWDFPPFSSSESRLVEKEYMFECCISRDLVPFLLLRTHSIFLPMDKQLQYDKTLKPEASSLYNLLNAKYKQHKKETSRIKTLWDYVNYLTKASHPNQKAKYKVIYPASGSFIKAALIEGHELIDFKLYYCPVECKEEGYYLVGILNSKSITKDLQLRGSLFGLGHLRDIQKKALDYPIPQFNKSNPLHNEISALANVTTQKAKDLVEDWKKKELEKKKKKKVKKGGNNNKVVIKPRSVQKLLLTELNKELEALDKLVRVLLNLSA